MADRGQRTEKPTQRRLDKARREGHFHAAQEIYLVKHYGFIGWQASRAGQILGSAVRAAVLRGPRGDAARRRLRLYLAGPRRSEVRPADSVPRTPSLGAGWPA